ncbi:MAG: cytochrome c biogenesis protein ResB [Nitrospirae bacterium]|nr:cytochrome c biogenesis protein ResB [Nitrospirota bacterium]
MASNRLYNTFSSLKTSVVILAAMSVFYILGTIFPQGGDVGDYMKAGGKYITIVKAFSLLNIFTSPLFLMLSMLLSANLVICIYERFKMMKARAKVIPLESIMNNPNLIEIGKGEYSNTIFSRLKGMRFRLIEEGEGYYVFGKGLPYWWLSWIYHLGIVVAIIGFLLTALMSFEKEATLYKDTPEKISLYSQETRLNEYLKKLGLNIPKEDKSKEYFLILKDFKTEYYQSLKFEYPKEKLSRLATVIGWRPIEPSKEGGLSPKMWKTALELKTPDNKTKEASLWVNHPFRYRGLTLYQMGFEQKMSMVVAGRTVEINSMEQFEIPGIKGKFITSPVKTGKVFKKDGTEDNVKPFFDLSYIPEGKKKEKLKEVYLGRQEDIRGVKVLFRNLKEGSSLSYRVDPGVPLIGISTLLVFLGLLVRCLGYWYRVYIVIKGRKIFTLISTRGLFANKDRILKNILNSERNVLLDKH